MAIAQGNGKLLPANIVWQREKQVLNRHKKMDGK